MTNVDADMNRILEYLKNDQGNGITQKICKMEGFQQDGLMVGTYLDTAFRHSTFINDKNHDPNWRNGSVCARCRRAVK